MGVRAVTVIRGDGDDDAGDDDYDMVIWLEYIFSWLL